MAMDYPVSLGRRGAGGVRDRQGLPCCSRGGTPDGAVWGDPVPAGASGAAPGEGASPRFLFCHILKALAHPRVRRRMGTPLRRSARQPGLRWEGLGLRSD